MSILNLQINRSNWLSSILDLRLGAFIIVCIILGGTSQEVVIYKTILYVSSILLIGYNFTKVRIIENKRFPTYPVLIGAAMMALHILYLIPLPPDVWGSLEGRQYAKTSFQMIDTPLPYMPLSLTPEKTLYSLLDFLPPMAILSCFAASPSIREMNYATLSIIAVALLSVFLGGMQILAGSGPFYLYETTNFGLPVGFFSNVNHQACFLAIALTITSGKFFHSLYSKSRRRSGARSELSTWAVLTMLFTIAVIATLSIAGYALIVISMGLQIMFWRREIGRKKLVLLIVSMLVLLSVCFFSFENHFLELVEEFTVQDSTSRSVIFENSMRLNSEFGFWGGGPGSFQDLFLLVEDRSILTWTYNPQAHNDYLQVRLEYGLLGLFLIAIFVMKLFYEIIRTLIEGNKVNYISFTCLSAVGLVFTHSLVDYPLRTVSIVSVVTFLMLYSMLKRDRVGSN